MNAGLCERLKTAVQFLVESGSARSYSEICRKAGISIPSLNMSVMGHRDPSVEMLVRLCDGYPISLRWLRKGEGFMIVQDRTTELLQKIEQLNNIIDELKRENELLKQTNPCL